MMDRLCDKGGEAHPPPLPPSLVPSFPYPFPPFSTLHYTLQTLYVVPQSNDGPATWQRGENQGALGNVRDWARAAEGGGRDYGSPRKYDHVCALFVIIWNCIQWTYARRVMIVGARPCFLLKISPYIFMIVRYSKWFLSWVCLRKGRVYKYIKSPPKSSPRVHRSSTLGVQYRLDIRLFTCIRPRSWDRVAYCTKQRDTLIRF